VGAVAASWKGIDGLIVATAFLLAIGLAALVNLRAHEGAILGAAPRRDAQTSVGDVIRDTLTVTGGGRPGPSDASIKEER
jgi:hypothetical protein